ncbi:unnamed protein product [Closterium sp. NIES-65]|nr:unnamed protein product [Closterium sp. NIES-65]
MVRREEEALRAREAAERARVAEDYNEDAENMLREYREAKAIAIIERQRAAQTRTEINTSIHGLHRRVAESVQRAVAREYVTLLSSLKEHVKEGVDAAMGRAALEGRLRVVLPKDYMETMKNAIIANVEEKLAGVKSAMDENCRRLGNLKADILAAVDEKLSGRIQVGQVPVQQLNPPSAPHFSQPFTCDNSPDVALAAAANMVERWGFAGRQEMLESERRTETGGEHTSVERKAQMGRGEPMAVTSVGRADKDGEKANEQRASEAAEQQRRMEEVERQRALEEEQRAAIEAEVAIVNNPAQTIDTVYARAKGSNEDTRPASNMSENGEDVVELDDDGDTDDVQEIATGEEQVEERVGEGPGDKARQGEDLQGMPQSPAGAPAVVLLAPSNADAAPSTPLQHTATHGAPLGVSVEVEVVDERLRKGSEKVDNHQQVTEVGQDKEEEREKMAQGDPIELTGLGRSEGGAEDYGVDVRCEVGEVKNDAVVEIQGETSNSKVAARVDEHLAKIKRAELDAHLDKMEAEEKRLAIKEEKEMVRAEEQRRVLESERVRIAAERLRLKMG